MGGVSRRTLLAASLLGGSAPAASGHDAAFELAFSDLPGWADDDHPAALRAYLRSCRRSGPPCGAPPAQGATAEAARRFFEAAFRPVEVAGRGFLTGYYEPEFPGSLTRSGRYGVPLLARPEGLVLLRGERPAGWPGMLAAARRTATGGYEALPDRGAIEEGALGALARPVLFLADPVDAFTVHVQGSARVRLEDGRVVRVGFDGRNGHPYTAIAKVLAEAEGLAPAEVTADRLWAWLKAHPDRAPAVMRANRSYIFFRLVETAPGDGPVGAAGVPLSAGRSLAVDHAAWPYGTLVWLDGVLPLASGGTAPLRRLVVAQDTGTAIVGSARGDLFVGSGPAAGREAGLLRHPVRWVVLRPRAGRPVSR